MQPDPAGMAAVDPTNPQSWNRYAYVLGNPLNFTDPSGMISCDAKGNNCYEYVSVTASALSEPEWWTQMWTLQTDAATQSPFGNIGECAGAGPASSISQCAQMGRSGAALGGGGGTNATPPGPQPKPCTAARQAAANLGKLFGTASSESGWIAFGTGTLTVLAGVGEEATFGLDTPATITAASVTSFFMGTSTVTGAFAAGLNSFASGNMAALQKFNFSQLASIAATAAASKIPALKPWADRIGDLAGQAMDLATKAKEACQ